VTASVFYQFLNSLYFILNIQTRRLDYRVVTLAHYEGCSDAADSPLSNNHTGTSLLYSSTLLGELS